MTRTVELTAAPSEIGRLADTPTDDINVLVEVNGHGGSRDQSQDA